jgi:hypothetical protein
MIGPIWPWILLIATPYPSWKTPADINENEVYGYMGLTISNVLSDVAGVVDGNRSHVRATDAD